VAQVRPLSSARNKIEMDEAQIPLNPNSGAFSSCKTLRYRVGNTCCEKFIQVANREYIFAIYDNLYYRLSDRNEFFCDFIENNLIDGFHVTSSPPFLVDGNKRSLMSCFVRPPAVVLFSIVIFVSRD